ncbi:DUF1385 domain-containing protein [bacterium]|nr:DUF1385 domain-containing protein [bacterium]
MGRTARPFRFVLAGRAQVESTVDRPDVNTPCVGTGLAQVERAGCGQYLPDLVSEKCRSPDDFPVPLPGRRRFRLRLVRVGSQRSRAKPSRSWGFLVADLRVNLAGIELRNPVIAASGAFGYGREYAELVPLARLGAITVKGISAEASRGNPTPRTAEVFGGMLNAIGLQNPGVDRFVANAEYLPFLRHVDTRVFVNIWGNYSNALMRLLVHLPFLPLVAGVSFEALRLSDRYSDSAFFRLLIAPGLALQRITTNPPDDSQIEVALTALKTALPENLEENPENVLAAESPVANG